MLCMLLSIRMLSDGAPYRSGQILVDKLAEVKGSGKACQPELAKPFTASAGEPSGILVPVSPVTVVMRDPAYLGMGVCAHANAVEQAIFSNVKFEVFTLTLKTESGRAMLG
jgi:hypothetical protein